MVPHGVKRPARPAGHRRDVFDLVDAPAGVEAVRHRDRDHKKVERGLKAPVVQRTGQVFAREPHPGFGVDRARAFRAEERPAVLREVERPGARLVVDRPEE